MRHRDCKSKDEINMSKPYFIKCECGGDLVLCADGFFRCYDCMINQDCKKYPVTKLILRYAAIAGLAIECLKELKLRNDTCLERLELKPENTRKPK